MGNSNVNNWVVGAALGATAIGGAMLLRRGTHVWNQPDNTGSAIQMPTIGQLVPPPSAPEPEPYYVPYTGSYNATATAPRVTGSQNVLERGGRLTKVYGRFKLWPKLAAQFVTVPQGNDTWGCGLFLLGIGPVQVDEDEIWIGDKKLKSFGTDVQYEILPGDDPENEKITLYTQDFKNTALSLALTHNVYAQKRAAQQAVRLQVDITFPNGLYATDSSGAKIADTVDIDVEYKLSTDVSWTKVVTTISSEPTLVCTDNTTISAKRTVSWTVPKGLYDVRVKRTSAETTTSKCRWTLLRAEGDTPVVRPYYDQDGNIIPIAYLAVKFRSSDRFNGVIDQLSVIVESKLPQWTGTEWTPPTATSNPAWIYADVLTGPCNARAIPKAQLNGDDLLDWADYCSTNNRGFNAALDGQQLMTEVLRSVAQAGRASVHFSDGKWTVVIDRKKTVIVQHITPFNVVKGSFRQKLSFPKLPHGVKVQFIDPDADWQVATRVAYADGYNVDGSNGLKRALDAKIETIAPMGCTSAEQAWRDGRYYQLRPKYRRREYQVMMDWEHIACDRGNLVLFSYDTALRGLYQGFISALHTNGSGDITGFDTTAEVLMESATDYAVVVRMPGGSDGTIQTYTGQVVTEVGATNTITLLTPIPAATVTKPAVGDLFSFGVKGLATAECLVASIEHHSDMTAVLTLIDHAPELFGNETEPAPAYNPGITSRADINALIPPPVIESIQSAEEVLIENADGSVTTRMLLTMGAPDPSVVSFEAWFKKTDAVTWTPVPLVPVSQGEISITGVLDGATYDIRVKGRSRNGYTSDWTYDQHTVIGKLTPPVAIASADILPGNILRFVYPNPPKDFAGARLKYHLGFNDNYASATVAADLIKGNQYNLNSIPRGPVTLMLAAVDLVGNESAPLVLLKDFGDPDVDNVILTDSQAPTFPGTITNGTVSGGVLQANDDGGLFWGSDDTGAFWGNVDSALFWNDSWQELVYEWSVTPSHDIGDNFFLAMAATIAGEGPRIDYRIDGQSAFWDGDDADDFWTGSDSDPFWGTEEAEWMPWPGKIPGTFARHDFRITCPASVIKRGEISQADVLYDVPDIVEYIDDFVYTPGSAERLPIQQLYRTITNVQLTLQVDPAYPNADKIKLLDKASDLGPLIAVYTSGGATTAGKIDATVKGY